MDPSTDAALIDLTRVALAERDDRAALGYLAHARSMDPKNPELAFQFGLICLKIDLLGEALKAMEQALQLRPEDPTYNLEYGAVLTLADDPGRALPYLLKYQTLRPADPAGDLALAAAYFAHNEYEKAEQWLKPALMDRRTAGAAHFYQGSMDRRRGNSTGALISLRASEQLSPEQPDVHAELGQAYLEDGQLTDAERELQGALRLDPKQYGANLALLVSTHEPAIHTSKSNRLASRPCERAASKASRCG